MCENKPYGPASDVWALGCVLYELCALKRPFDASNLFGIVYSVVKGDADLDAVSTDEDHWLRLLVKRLLTKDAEKRPTIAQVLKDTEGLQEHVLCQGPVVSPDQYDDDFETYNGEQPSVADACYPKEKNVALSLAGAMPACRMRWRVHLWKRGTWSPDGRRRSSLKG